MVALSAEAKQGKAWTWLIVALLVGSALRVGLLVHFAGIPPEGDQRAYVAGAEEILAGETYTGRRGPGYSFWVAASQWVVGGTGAGLEAGRWGNLPLALLTIVLCWLVARDLFGQRVATLVAFWIAIQPRFVQLPLYYLSENLYVPCIAGALWLALRGVREGRAGWFVGAGAAFGLAALTREMVLVFIPAFAFLCAWCERRAGRGVWRNPALLLAVAAACIVPWTLRNWRVYDAFIPVGFADGIPLFEGNYPEREPGEANRLRRDLNVRFYLENGESELVANRLMRDEAWKWIRRRQPTWIFEKLARNGPRLLQPWTVTPQLWQLEEARHAEVAWRRAVMWTYFPMYLAVLLLLPFGLAQLRREPGDVLLCSYLAFSVAVHIVANAGFARFQMPYEWILILFAASVLTRGFPRGRRRILAWILFVVIVGSQPWRWVPILRFLR